MRLYPSGALGLNHKEFLILFITKGTKVFFHLRKPLPVGAVRDSGPVGHFYFLSKE